VRALWKWSVVMVLGITVIALAFAVGYTVGSGAQHRRLVAFGLKTDLILYRAAERGDLAPVKQQLGTVLVARTRTYEALFTDAHSSATFLEAEKISREIEAKEGPRIPVPLRENTK
jgi:hypothetical protein